MAGDADLLPVAGLADCGRADGVAARTHPAPPGAGCTLLRAAAVAALLAAPALAAPAVRGSVEGGFSLARLDYVERGPTDSVLDRESGLLPAATLALELHPSRWSARVSASAGAGDLRYAGRTQSPDVSFDDLPVETTSGARVLALELQGGAFVDPGRRLALYAGAAYRAWQRRIASTTVVSRSGSVARVPELDEEYSWFELLGGVRCTLSRTWLGDWLLDARLSRVIGGRVVVDLPAEDATLHPGDRFGGRLASAFRFSLASGWSLLVEAHWARWRLGASPVDPRSLLYEPESESRTVGLDTRLVAKF